ncbi:hypothetical protein ERO13_D06G145650v2 [Gossypium hirsutum]|uniref:Uncharacterized protein n=2 Tax=Gossypium TaxID=3633 RepID=A0A5J5R2X8_GOSBA|nr:hypothetical protein ES319_D06G171300v1 [Gossypium barbadense]KAB2025765.1 hypothetical protein ES319_D06G171300v1 [Gossypium barbadense]KAG4142706.1 hypothetical protein ERO13_D06G145650v2 [Gossypium hirsutum]KAG4142707.1 hypothetical protein ERO13_D06G145650v2 [Gossypium hirsutum]KAG4142708.1 hypothetical protein ERO13_D06G145650v2 [Gossypium hirsutum]
MVFCGFELVLEPGRMDIAAAAVQAFIGALYSSCCPSLYLSILTPVSGLG